jgi:glycosyltransferase involved in cell wall biosynthesis
VTVLQVVPELDIPGGTERTTIDVGAAIVSAGWRALIATEGGRHHTEASAYGAEIFRMPVESKNPFVMASNVARLADLTRRYRVDIIHARSRACAWSALGAARITGTPLVTTYAGIYNEGFPGKRFYNSVMARGDRVIANSYATGEHVRKIHGTPEKRLVVIPRGIDLAEFNTDTVNATRLQIVRSSWGLREKRRLIVLPGRLTRWKGQSVLIEAAALIRNMGREDFMCILVGDEQGRETYTTELNALVARLSLGEHVSIVGHCPDMAAAYKLADVVVSASIEPEAFGRVAVEAQAMERPIIATAIGGSRETIVPNDTGFLVPPNDPETLASAIVQVLDAAPSDLVNMGARARRHVESRYSVDAMCAATLQVYRGLLAQRESADRARPVARKVM